jgi:hypothetical protein
MARRLQEPPIINPVKPLATKPPPVSKTQDNFTHHTSPVQGPQPVPPEVVAAQTPRAAVKTLPDVPMHTTKFSNPVGRPKQRNYE